MLTYGVTQYVLYSMVSRCNTLCCAKCRASSPSCHYVFILQYVLPFLVVWSVLSGGRVVHGRLDSNGGRRKVGIGYSSRLL